jgi:hypothetical protein
MVETRIIGEKAPRDDAKNCGFGTEVSDARREFPKGLTATSRSAKRLCSADANCRKSHKAFTA